jgi:hypothetical protein
MNLKQLALVLLLLVPLFAKPQSQPIFRFGLSCGSSISQIVKPYEASYEKPKAGIYPKVFCRLPLKHGFWLQTEAGPLDNGIIVIWDNDSIYQRLAQSRYFVQFTEIAGYTKCISRKQQLFLNLEAGLFYSIYLSSFEHNYTKDKITNTSYETKEWNNLLEDYPINRSQAGISTGFGLSKTLGYGKLFFDFRYDRCLTIIFRLPPGLVTDLPYKEYYQLFSVSTGFIFGKNKVKK